MNGAFFGLRRSVCDLVNCLVSEAKFLGCCGRDLLGQRVQTREVRFVKIRYRLEDDQQRSCRVTSRISERERARRPPRHMIPVSRQVLMGGNNAT